MYSVWILKIDRNHPILRWSSNTIEEICLGKLIINTFNYFLFFSQMMTCLWISAPKTVGVQPALAASGPRAVCASRKTPSTLSTSSTAGMPRAPTTSVGPTPPGPGRTSTRRPENWSTASGEGAPHRAVGTRNRRMEVSLQLSPMEREISSWRKLAMEEVRLPEKGAFR